MIAKFRYHREKLCIEKIRRDCEIFAMVAKFSQSLRNFRNAIAKILHSCIASFISSASISSVPLHISSSRLDEIVENSSELCINQHQYEAKLEMLAEVPKTCKTTKNNLETKSVVLNGSAHVNWLNSYD